MKPSLIALSAAVLVTVVSTGMKARDQIADKLDLLLGNSEPVENAQLMRMGRVTGPGFPTFPKQDDRPQEMAQADLSLTGNADAAPSAPATTPVSTDAGQAKAPAMPLDLQAATVNPAPAAATPSSAKPRPVVDESALRYFASRGDTARLAAEISRLRALYPDWTPPADPLAVPQNEDKGLESMWQLYSQGHFAEVRKAIADRQTADPSWQPPADLLDRLNVAESRLRLVNASDLKQYETVVSIGSETPSLLTCSDIDVLWRVADAFAHTDRMQRSVDAYLYILKNCDNPPERLSTVQKASTVLPYPMMQDLLAQERPLPGGTREFDSIRDDLSRRFVAAANDDPKLQVSPDDLSRVERAAETQKLASDALLLGWYDLRHDRAQDAEKWFRSARATEDGASASQGLALTLIARKSPQEAEDVMYKWQDSSKEATKTYLAATANLMALDPPAGLSTEVLGRIAAVVLKEHDETTAQQFGWYARSLNQHAAAAQWFETALRWKPDDEPSAYGLALSRNQLNDKPGVLEVQRLWAGRSERIARLGEPEPKAKAGARQPLPAPGLDRTTQTNATMTMPMATTPPFVASREEPPAAPARLVETVEPRQAARTQARTETRGSASVGCAATIDPATLSPAAALPRAWCLMNLNRPVEAAAAFEVALHGSNGASRQDAAYGLSLAYLRLGLTSQAASAATKAPLGRDRALALQTSILSNRASNAFSMKRYRETILYLDQLAQLQPERIDLMLLRGYAYQNLHRYSDAIRIFEAAAATGSHEAITALTYAREAQASPPGR